MAAEDAAHGQSGQPEAVKPWRNPKVRAIFFQILVLGGVGLLAYYLISNTMQNLAERQIQTGFDFLENEAGFFIGEAMVDYAASDSYGRAFLIGILNTIRVAFLGIVLSTIIGTIVGVARLSSNFLIAKLASIYVETVRNIPLLLQLFFWYAVITGLLPTSKSAVELLPSTFLSKSGLIFPVPIEHPVHMWMGLGFLVGIVGVYFYYRYAKKRQDATGQQLPLLLPTLGFLIGIPAIIWLLGGAPSAMDFPEWQKFRYDGGTSLTPEFIALLLGLTIYTAGFIAEIVRSGIVAVPHGQTEAASALGLRRSKVLRLVLLPQALRIIVPPTTSQYLNLTKNSSLAVAIGYPDLVSVGNTTLNQTGQAIECITIMMAVYLTISLLISAFMNWYNKHIALVER
ncbi:MAG: amino acid ABC transporter permease [Rhodovibrionaceae bacterium]|nr:amino acid ABC transporter permease [Rhodovibrionaceae bacterium]